MRLSIGTLRRGVKRALPVAAAGATDVGAQRPPRAPARVRGAGCCMLATPTLSGRGERMRASGPLNCEVRWLQVL